MIKVAKKVVTMAAIVGAMPLITAQSAWSLSEETTMLLDLLTAKGILTEKEAGEFTQALEAKTAAIAPAGDESRRYGQRLAEQVECQEVKKEPAPPPQARDKVSLSGLVEVAAIAARRQDAAGVKTTGSDLTLATAQINADTEINPYISGHLALLYEEEPNDSGATSLDEAIITIKGGEETPVYAHLGRQYLPFGHFETHFISDPLPLALGETNETALIAGYGNDIVDLNAGLLRAKVNETGTNHQVDTAVASVSFTLPGSTPSGLFLSGGFSYLSNLAASDTLADANGQDGAISGEITDNVDGLGAFLSLIYAERFFFEAEYLGALSDFALGDFAFIDADNRRPRSWNIEAAAALHESLEFALRYGGTREGGANFLAEHEYGAALSYAIFANTSLTIEYLFQQFQDNSDNSQGTMQVAVEF